VFIHSVSDTTGSMIHFRTTVCTVVAYLKTHKRMPTGAQMGASEYFSKYLVAAVLAEDATRGSMVWSSRDISTCLAAYRMWSWEMRCLPIPTRFQPSPLTDITASWLWQWLRWLENGSMKSLLELSRCSNGWDFAPLLTSFNRMKNDQPHEDDGVYDPNYLLRIHQLLIATFSRMGRRSVRCRKPAKEPKEPWRNWWRNAVPSALR